MSSPALRLLGVVAILATCSGVTRAADVAEFLNFSLPTLPGRLYIPPEAATEPRPLILFMHGAGEVGTDNVRQVNFEIDTLFEQAKARGAFVYAPQSPVGGWSATRTTDIMTKIDQAIAGYNVDTDRLYATGLSMGGGGVWNVLNRYGDRFAAAVPTAAITPESDFVPENLVGKPIWAFHARNDDVVTVLASQLVVGEVLTTAGLDNLVYPPSLDLKQTFLYEHEQLDFKYTELPVGGHSIWHDVYARSDVHDWLFSQSLSTPTSEPLAPNGQVSVRSGIFGEGPQVLLRDSQGDSVSGESGFAAIGLFDLTDSQIAAADASSLAGLADSFVQFGPSLLLGEGSSAGLINMGMAAGFPSDHDLLGKNIYMVFGDGDSIATSTSLGVVKSNQLFQTLGEGALTLLLQVPTAGGPLVDGEVLLGELSSENNSRYGVRGYITAADVTVPEPSAWLLAALSAPLLAWRPGNPRPTLE